VFSAAPAGVKVPLGAKILRNGFGVERIGGFLKRKWLQFWVGVVKYA
jgi:hypothetical protein